VSRALRVVWEGDFGGTGSLAQVNIELATRVAGAVDLRVLPTGARSTDARVLPFVGRSLASVDVVIRHASPPILEPPAEGKWVWMQPWEYGPCLPTDWLRLMQRQTDAVWVYSDWVRRQFVDNGVPADRVTAVALGVDVGRFRPDAAPRTLPTDKRCRILYLGGLTHRKGIDILLAVYREIFSSDDDVVLVIKEFDPGGAYAPIAFRGIDEIFAGEAAPSVLRLPIDLPASDLPGVYTACSALVHPYRAEGFCLPMAEAMASGCPVIATDLGGASEFATSETAALLPSILLHLPSLELGRRRLSNFPGWREASRADLAAAMRALYQEPGSLAPMVDRARCAIAAAFTWDHAAARLLRALEAVVETPAREAREIETENSVDLVARGQSSLESRDLDTAAAAFHRALGPTASAPPAEEAAAAAAALAGLGRVAWARGVRENAYRFHRLAVERAPDDRRLALAFARFAAGSGHESEAAQLFERLLDADDDDVRTGAAEGMLDVLLRRGIHPEIR
jgi:glycosyltransferase involved in cell wall biosynthesis